MSCNKSASNEKTGLVKIFFYIICSVVALFLIIILFITIMTRTASKLPTIFGYGFCVITNDNVDGSVKSNSIMIVKDIDAKAIKVGDSITYKDGYDSLKYNLMKSNTVVDISTKDNKYLFETNDEKGMGVGETQVIGKSQHSILWLGKVFLFIKTPLGLIVCVAIPLLLLLIFEIINLVKLTKAQKEEEDNSFEDDLPSYMRIPIKDEPKKTLKNSIYNDEESSDILSNEFVFEEQDEELELVGAKSPFETLSYKKPTITQDDVNVNSIYSTKEFDVPKTEIKEENIIKEKPSKIKADDICDVIDNSNFYANIAKDTKSNFDIEGISFEVQPNAVNLKVNKDVNSRDISITVTNEYTNVIFNSKKHEVNFAFLNDETDSEKKVIIQKKTKV